MTRWRVLGLVTLLIIIAAVLLFVLPSPAHAPEYGVATPQKASLKDLIVLDSPLPGAVISSPLTLTGKARESWYFEASFPVEITDWDGRIIAQGHAEAQGDWMTTEYVPFTAVLAFTVPASSASVSHTGSLILHNDNPSGDPARERALTVPIVFK